MFDALLHRSSRNRSAACARPSASSDRSNSAPDVVCVKRTNVMTQEHSRERDVLLGAPRTEFARAMRAGLCECVPAMRDIQFAVLAGGEAKRERFGSRPKGARVWGIKSHLATRRRCEVNNRKTGDLDADN